MEFLKYESLGFIGILTIDRVKAMNALNTVVLDELQSALHMVDLNVIRCLIITGGGNKAFVAGADVAEMSSFTKQQGKMFSEKGNHIFLEIEQFPIPVIAAVNGYALGGGCELAMSCDIRVCSENGKFGQPEVGLGISPGFGGTQRLSRIVGAGKAKELIYTTRVIDAKEAYRIGLVNYVYSQDEFMSETIKLAERIAGNAPIAVQRSKEAINCGAHMEIKEAVGIEARLFGDCFETLDQHSGMEGFLEKRKSIEFVNK